MEAKGDPFLEYDFNIIPQLCQFGARHFKAVASPRTEQHSKRQNSFPHHFSCVAFLCGPLLAGGASLSTSLPATLQKVSKPAPQAPAENSVATKLNTSLAGLKSTPQILLLQASWVWWPVCLLAWGEDKLQGLRELESQRQELQTWSYWCAEALSVDISHIQGTKITCIMHPAPPPPPHEMKFLSCLPSYITLFTGPYKQPSGTQWV